MKVSLNLAQQFSNVDLKNIPRDELLRRIGAQLGAVEEVVDWAPRYDGVVVAKIVSCEDHPNADRLHVCTIDDGGITPDVKRDTKGHVQVVCGAPNAREGLLVAWLPPGSVVPSTYGKDPFRLEARELRGVISNGMLASPKELGLSDDHEGILEIDEQVKPGTPFSRLYGLDDFVVDCENKMFTHRPDCFGNLGVARELAGISGQAFKSPDWYLKADASLKTKESKKLAFNAENKIPKLVPRFMAVALTNIKVQKSPIWLQSVLSRVGIKPINNVVDITNYVMHLTGQPLHAFDYDKINKRSDQVGIFPRSSRKGEKLVLLGQKQIELTGEEVVISTDKQAVALAGVMGGAETEVDDRTENIIIECATFDMYNIRRTSMRYGLFTDAVTRYTKGQSPLQNDRVLNYAMKMLVELAGAVPASKINDIKSGVHEPKPVVVSTSFINDRLGSNLSIKEMARLLENVEFDILSVPADKTKLHIRPPFWRTDIEIAEDIVEEIGRLHSYDKLPVNLPKRVAAPVKRDSLQDFKMHLRNKLKAAGANEVLTYSFVHGDLMRKTGTDPEKYAFHIRNALSPGLQYYRTRLIPSLLEKVQGNIRSDLVGADDNDFAIFEIGKTHIKGLDNEEGLPRQMERLALVFAADDKTAARKYHGSAYYQAKKYLTELTNGQAVFTPLGENGHDVTTPHEPARSAVVSIAGKDIGIIGEFSSSVRQLFKLPDFCAGFELDINLLQELLEPATYAPVPVFPKITADITLEVGAVSHADVQNTIGKVLEEASAARGYEITLVPRDMFAEQGANQKRLTFRIWVSHPERTLTTEEVNKLLDSIADTAKTDLGATRI